MIRQWLVSTKILTGICVLAGSAFSQTYTISAKPGAVNFIEGEVSVNGDPVWTSNLKSTFLKENDTIAVKNGKAEVLLTPGVFLRLGQNTQVRMIKPSLIETQLEIISGESMVEVDDLVPGSSVGIIDHGSSTNLGKPGLYRFSERSIATLDGKAEVMVGDRKVDLKKNKELQLGEALTDGKIATAKVDLSEGDDLYAWSNTRAQYNAAATYAGSRAAYDAGGYGFSSFNSPGWYWSSPFSSYMWLPGNGAFYSPFGWGFYGPGVVMYAPVVGLPYYGGRGYYNGSVPVGTVVKGAPVAVAAGTVRPAIVNVPVNPNNVPVTNFRGTSPAAFAAARLQMQQTFANSGMRTANGAPAANLRSGQTFSNMQAASHAASSNARSSSAASNGGGFAGGRGSGSGVSSNSRGAGSSMGGMSHGSGGGHSK